MGRSVSFLLIRQFLTALVYGIGFVAIMTLESTFAIGRGIWEQSDHVARIWMDQLHVFRMDSWLNEPMYWIIRFISIILMLVCTLFISWIILRIFGL